MDKTDPRVILVLELMLSLSQHVGDEIYALNTMSSIVDLMMEMLIEKTRQVEVFQLEMTNVCMN